MKRLFSFCLFFAACAFSAQAQQPPPAPGVVAGVVTESASSTPIPSATVSLWSAQDSSLVTGSITDADGRFRIEGVRLGTYELRVSFVGFRTHRQRIELTPSAPRLELGTLSLSEDAAQMEGVEVEAEREAMEVAIDRTIYNTKDQIVASGGNATDLLRNIPSVEVDSEGAVSLRGNGNVAILVNGRPAPVPAAFIATFLQGLPANSIERIEVIPNPSAKYEPDGMAGMLNIVLKQNTSLATNGTLMAGGASTGSYNASANLNTNPGKWLLSATYGLRHDARAVGGSMFRSGIGAATPDMRQTDDSDMTMDSHTLNGSADYKLGEQSTLYATAMGALRQGSRDGTSSSTLQNGRTVRFTDATPDGFTMDYALGFRRVVTPSQHEFTAEARYNRSRNGTYQRFHDLTTDLDDTVLHERRTRDDQDNRSQETSFQLDYTRPLPGEVKLEAGAKSTLRWLDDALVRDTLLADDRYQTVSERSTAFDYQDQVHAAYATLGAQRGKLSAQAGLRVEQALLDFSVPGVTDKLENDYLSFYPSFFASYAITQAQQVKFAYSKRVNRPPTFLLSPVPQEMDERNRRVGNPDLKPEYTHAFELTYTAFAQGKTVTVSPFFRRTVDALRPNVTYDDATSVLTQSITNAETSDSYGAELIGTLRVGQKLNFMANASVYRMVTDAGANIEASLGNDLIAWTMRGNMSYSIRKGTDFQATAFYRSPMAFEQFRLDGLLITDFALRQALSEKLSLNVRVSDPLDVARMHYHGELAAQDLVQEGNRYWGQQALNVTLTWNFGRQGPRPQRRPQQAPQPQQDGGGFGF